MPIFIHEYFKHINISYNIFLKNISSKKFCFWLLHFSQKVTEELHVRSFKEAGGGCQQINHQIYLRFKKKKDFFSYNLVKNIP